MRRLLAGGFWFLLVGLVVVGCGSGADNGVASKSPDAIVSAASNAVAGASTVHVAGTINNGGSPTTIDLFLAKGKGGKGLMGQSGVSFKVLTLNGEVYVNGSAAFWRHFGGNPAAQLLNGKWLKAPASGQFAPLAMLTNPQDLFSQLVGNHGTLAKGKTTTVRGRSVIAVKDTTRGGTLYVATTGKPYPVEISKGGSGGGRVDFDQFNQPVSLAPPSPAIDISQLK